MLNWDTLNTCSWLWTHKLKRLVFVYLDDIPIFSRVPHPSGPAAPPGEYFFCKRRKVWVTPTLSLYWADQGGKWLAHTNQKQRRCVLTQGTVCRGFSSLYIEDHFTLSHYTLGICHVWLLGNSVDLWYRLLYTTFTTHSWDFSDVEILVFYLLFNQIPPELDLWELIWPPHMLHCDFV